MPMPPTLFAPPIKPAATEPATSAGPAGPALTSPGLADRGGTSTPAPSRRPAASLPALVSRVYAALPLPERARLLEPLIKPVGVLALMVVAGGVFARLRLQAGWPGLHLPLGEVARVSADEVAALAEHAQQMGRVVLDPLLQVLADLMPEAPGRAELGALGEALARWSSDRGAADATLAVLSSATVVPVLSSGRASSPSSATPAGASSALPSAQAPDHRPAPSASGSVF
jgi:hypothetical protein